MKEIQEQGQGERYLARKIVLTNKTGADVTLGAIGVIDESRANAASVDIASALSNVVAVTTTNIANGTFVVAAEPIASGKDGHWYESYEGGIVDIQVNGNSAIAAGDGIKGQNASAVSIVAATTDRTIATALEAYSTNATATKKARLYSRNLRSIS